jgi:hypothetical protein
MVAKKGKYTWIGNIAVYRSFPSILTIAKFHLSERAFEDDEDDAKEDSSANKGKEKEKEEPIPPSKLSPEVQALCRLIFSTK